MVGRGSLFFLLFLFIPLLPSVLAQEADKPSMIAHPIEDQQMTLDGLLDEGLWKKFPPISGFIQQEPKAGEQEKGTTQVWVFYDSSSLYIGANLIDPEPQAVRGDERHRDAAFSRSDAFGAIIDTFHDHQNGFFFETNLLGAKSDGLIHQEGAFVNMEWDGLWEVAALRTNEGWSVEMKIPFETLRFQPGQSDTWGIQFRRKIPHLKEIAFWSPLTTDQNFYMLSKGGHLTGIQPRSIKGQLFIKPYLKGDFRLNQGESAGWETGEDAGLDVRYRIKSNLTIDLTYQTDFAETESDRLQVNLTRFPLFFPEKREFFLEGSDYFAFGISESLQPFFSRRIGLRNQQPVPLIGGIKLTGKVEGYSLGLLSIASRSNAGLDGEELSVFRFTRDIGLRSRGGIILTDRTGPTGSDQTGGFDLTAGPHPNLDLQGFWLRSGWPNPSPYGANGDRSAGFAEVYWHDPFWRIKMNHLRVTEGFNPSLGFVKQTDLDETVGYVDIHPQPVTGPVREYGFKGELTYQNDTSGNFIYRSNYWRGQASFRSGDLVFLSWDLQSEHLPVDFEIRRGIVIPTGDYTYRQGNLILHTDPRRSVSVIPNFSWGDFYNGHKESMSLNLTWSVIETFKLGGSIEVDWVNLPQGNFVAEIVAQNIQWDLNNQMALQTLTQWDKETQQWSGNVRYSWEYRQGSWFYLVINPLRTDPQTRLLFLAKLTYLFRV